MLTYRVEDMTCGHCASTIAKAVRAVDAGAKVQIDLAHHLVSVEATESDEQELSDAITEAGYTPVPIDAASAAMPAAKKSGCCGCSG